MSDFSFVDLFSGAGGFTEGLLLAQTSQARFRLVAASDLHEPAAATHKNRFNAQLGIDYAFLTSDIRKNDFREKFLSLVEDTCGKAQVDVVVGGPPCQGFSVFGLRNHDDPRNDLFRPYLKVVQALRPKYFVMENVPGLETMYGGKTVELIHQAVAKMGPDKYGVVGPIRVNAADFGVPQTRERVLFIGYRADQTPIEKILPTHSGPYITVKQAIGDLAFLRGWEESTTYRSDQPARTEFQKSSRLGRWHQLNGKTRSDFSLKNHEASRHTPDVIARFAMMEPGKGFDSIPQALWDGHLQSSKRWCVRLNPDQPSYTVVTLPDDFVHYDKPRTLTVREMARLQSFDDTFEFLGPRTSGGGGKGNKKRNSALPQYTQVGNAVPPLLAKAVGEVLLRALQSKENQKRISLDEVPA